MAIDTDKKTRTPGNIFDEDITTLYALKLPEPRRDAYQFEVHDFISDDERHMANAFHQQHVAVEGRTAIAKLVTTRVGDMATHASRVMAQTMENVEAIESAAATGRLTRRLQDYNNKILDQSARHTHETIGVAVWSMHEDMRRSPYPPPPPRPEPPKPKFKGVIPAFFEFLFGEE